MARPKIPMNEVLALDPNGSQTTIRRYYKQWRKDQGLRDRCDIETCPFHTNPLVWRGAELPLILDHVDGNRNNSLPSNLRYVCPNCNSQLSTTGGRNRGRVKQTSKEGYILREPDGKEIHGATGKATANWPGILSFLAEELERAESRQDHARAESYRRALAYAKQKG